LSKQCIKALTIRVGMAQQPSVSVYFLKKRWRLVVLFKTESNFCIKQNLWGASNSTRAKQQFQGHNSAAKARYAAKKPKSMADTKVRKQRTATKTWRWTVWRIYIHGVIEASSTISYFTQTIQSKSQSFASRFRIPLAERNGTMPTIWTNSETNQQHHKIQL
jgi:hypothetical protein